MELKSLQVFVEVVRQGGFSAAAQRVHLTQPSISRHIQQLEAELEQRLLRREHRRVVLTEAGRIAYQRALVLLGESARLRSELDDLAGLKRGQLVLGVAPFGASLFVPLLEKFRKRCPAVELRLFEQGSDAIERALVSGELEAGTLLLPLDRERFDSVPLKRDVLVLLAASDSPWARRKSVRLAELSEEPFILFPQGYALNETISTACQRAGFVPRVAGRSGQGGFVAALVERGVGVALLPRSLLASLGVGPGVALQEPSIRWDLVLAWPRERYLSVAARTLIELARRG